MTVVRVGVVVFFCVAITNVALADPYTYYETRNDLGQPVTFTRFESPKESCESLNGNLWTTAPLAFVEKAVYFSSTAQCVVRTEANGILVGSVVALGGSCSGSIDYDFALQACVDNVDEKHIHATLLALYLWLCLIGGMSVGLKAGQ